MSVFVRRISSTDPRLGRHVRHDPRSWEYRVTPQDRPLVTTMHARRIPILDQELIGSCTGNAAVGHLGTDPVRSPFHTAFPDVPLDESDANSLYSAATQLDPYAGQWPPDDTGSDGLSIAKAARARGWCTSYLHAFTLDAALDALLDGPLITGVNWYEGFDYPDANGFVTVSGEILGGHEFVVRGIDVDTKTIHADNSWGPGWGNAGSFQFTWEDWERLLSEQGDVTILKVTGISPPPPVDPLTADKTFAAALRRNGWVTAHHWFDNGEAAAARAWLAARGL
jgi:hypothetical protein